MENVFDFRNELISEYSAFSRSFAKIAAADIKQLVEAEYVNGRYWPDPLIQINPNYQRQGTIQELAAQGVVHAQCAEIFRTGKNEGRCDELSLFKHQMEALAKGQSKQSYVVTTGTGSGKSLSFFIPVVDAILKGKDQAPKPRTRAIVIYPMNALANSQLEELDKFLTGMNPQPFTVARYTGQETREERERIANNPPDILLTNFMMLELILTRYEEVDRRVVENCRGLEFLILDELHTYRGRQGADVAILVRRLRQRMQANELVCIGTSATMSSTGKQAERNKVVAGVASKLFGTSISAHDIIGETLERVTNPDKDVSAIRNELKAEVLANQFHLPDYTAFINSPMAIWVELNLGIEFADGEPPKRAQPKTLAEAGELLAKDTGTSFEQAKTALQSFLLQAHGIHNPQGRAPFAFKLHQFISGPGKVLTTLEAPGSRYITLDAQKFAPGRQQQNTLLYSTHFCRDCGQEYHPVWRAESGSVSFSPREISETAADPEQEQDFGFLCPRHEGLNYHGLLEELPEHWLDFSKAEPKLKSSYKNAAPHEYKVDADGQTGRGEDFWFVPGKFRFCLSCSQTYDAHGKDSNRLASLSGEGRSSATTVLTLAALRQLFALQDLPEHLPDPRKLLGFSDNRQDAALQAGHFNDFLFLLSLRAGLIGALQRNHQTLAEEELAGAVFKALGFDRTDEETLGEYLQNPKAMGLARQEAQRTLRFVLGYRLLRDLRRGWRFNNPNLEQLGILQVGYNLLEDFCSDEVFANTKNSDLRKLSPGNRAHLSRLLFDEMRRSLCLHSIYLDPAEQDKNRNRAFNELQERWGFETDEKLETSHYLVTVSRPEYRGRNRMNTVSAAPRSRIVRLLKRADFWKDTALASQVQDWKDDEWVELIEDLLELALHFGYVSREPLDKDVTGYRLSATALQWRLLDDDGNNASNPYFRQLYYSLAGMLCQPEHPLFVFEAQEHTAQVDGGDRQILEQRFRYTQKDRDDWLKAGNDRALQRLPVMFCSPTMELGVDISALNTVYLRNVPPTPANYAQRSGRAGRSGQQAIVITYCASLSPHDQWFFHNANDMVHGVVKAPTLDLGNQELIKSHLHATWLACAETELESSIAQLLDLETADKDLLPALQAVLNSDETGNKARLAVQAVVEQLQSELQTSLWFSPCYVEQVIKGAPAAFSAALDRWRNLYDATQKQMAMADTVLRSHASSEQERKNAQRRYNDASNQLSALLKTGSSRNSDFYTYRYLASQGFLPGYNFPRLPLMAWIPSRGSKGGKIDDGSMVSRPRFLALSEFGPRSLIYHQGRMYRVNRAKLNVGNSDHISGGSTLATISSRICSQCGYGHLGELHSQELLTELCQNCDALLTESDWVRELYRIETVETEPVERISANEEERQRQGFELQTTYRFLPGPDGSIQKQKALVFSAEEPLAELTYAPAARIWRINRGWRRRKNKEQLGFHINPITGLWSKQDDASDDSAATMEEKITEKARTQRIVPFVEDHRNLLILQPRQELSLEAMATVQAALKRGIEMTFQIEESELVAEPLPRLDERRGLLFYEAAEGGAGVLTRLASEPESLAQVAARALELMHFTPPAKGSWDYQQLPQQEQTDELGNAKCEAGCYQCLLSYFNQPDHDHINRRNQQALELLVALANANVQPAHGTTPASITATDKHDTNDLHSQWLQALAAHHLPIPDTQQVAVNQGAATAAGQYKAARVLVFLTALHADIASSLQERGWQVLDFSQPARWPESFAALASHIQKNQDTP
ncbi:DEAD/DEAH box helicase [Thiopseudomonas denitrificans]|uniref:ATP-dependent helicase YprA (DUF1998 family) n=1 Tax=Thiopseudomonas denitrificans TaxID=1501432 RepID=A0A4R6TZB5_9GAMM|nr:DEAD/DEAH box helicase [Thiopseudomonas denitrificans]TDQ38961.1 ATP-dependent helicase YprA (DUF1998 family) [Thiopseudomonas denitrificans]